MLRATFILKDKCNMCLFSYIYGRDLFLSDINNNLLSGLNKEYRFFFNILGYMLSGPHGLEVYLTDQGHPDHLFQK